MRMSVQMPRPVVGTIPDSHGIVAEDDGLSVYRSARLFSQKTHLLACVSPCHDCPAAQISSRGESRSDTLALGLCLQCRNLPGSREHRWLSPSYSDAPGSLDPSPQHL